MFSGEFWQNKLNLQESEFRSQELEEEKMPEPLMAVMMLIFMIEIQERAMACSSKKYTFALFTPLPLAGEGPVVRAKE